MKGRVTMCCIAFDGNAVFTSLALLYMESLYGQNYGKLIIHERHEATPVCSGISQCAIKLCMTWIHKLSRPINTCT